ncbi:MAG: helix-turn-helix domain-containing protein [Bacteroidales bacterium]|nr:helix-turn-helix domain-containing protein [Bacteroidales bacterium]
MSQILQEITPLSDKDCFYVVERHKSEFVFPIHSHSECELNFIENGAGVRRIVGDSVEEIGDYELTLVTGERLEHAWEQGNCRSADIREITIQFSRTLFSADILARKQFRTIREMFERASNGLAFSLKAIMKVYAMLDVLASEPDGFEQFQHFLQILYILSNDEGSRVLASSSFAKVERSVESRRVQKIQEYINAHYSEEIRLDDCAALAGMAPSAFSRFFKQHTGRTLLDYIIDIRLGHAARMLVDTTFGISEISYSCGFNNLSNFNRTFKARRGYTPRDFRTLFRKNRVFV